MKTKNQGGARTKKGSVKAGSSASVIAKRERKPKAPPAANPMAVSGWKGYLFSEQDITDFAKQSGVTLLPNINNQNAALRLHNAFDLALDSFRRDQRAVAPSDLKSWYSDVAVKATALLNTLGFVSVDETLKAHDLLYDDNAPDSGFRATKDGIFNLRDEIILGKFLPLWPLLPLQVLKAVNRQEIISQHDGERPTLELLNEHSWKTALMLLEASPWIISVIAKAGQNGASAIEKKISKGGKKKDSFRVALFACLAHEFKQITGYYPTVRDYDRRDPNAPAVTWFRTVIETAAKNIESAMHPWEGNCDAAIRGLTKLSPGTIADHIESGVSAYKRWMVKVSGETP